MTRLSAILLLVLATSLAACTGGTRSGSDVLETRLYTVEKAGGAGRRLIPYTTLDGYMAQAGGGGAGSVARMITGASDLKPLVRSPVAVGVGEGGVYIVDDATQSLYRFRWLPERAKEGLPGADFKHLRTLTDLDDPTDLHVSVPGDLFISDGKGKKVVQYDQDANRVREFSDEENLNQPVAVTTDKRGLRVFVADGLYDRVIAFNRAGVSLYGMGGRGDGDADGTFRNIRSMIQGPDGLLYVVDGVNRQINVFGLDGSYISSFGKNAFTDPGGIAVDDEGRVYLSDGFNHKIVIFSNRRVVEVYGKPGYGPGEFQNPGNLAYYQGRLYVVDRQNARIQVLRVVPEEQVRQRPGAGEGQ